MACVGAALGLRCTVRALDATGRARRNWLLTAASAIGSGIWTMHFVAMLGFGVTGTDIRYDVPLTVLSLVVAMAVVGVGVLAVGHGGRDRARSLLVGGLTTGVGVASMHYLGMAALRLHGRVRYDPLLVGLSVLIAVVAATAALWAALHIHAPAAVAVASLVMGAAVSSMHYTGMLAVSVEVAPPAPPSPVPRSCSSSSRSPSASARTSSSPPPSWPLPDGRGTRRVRLRGAPHRAGRSPGGPRAPGPPPRRSRPHAHAYVLSRRTSRSGRAAPSVHAAPLARAPAPPHQRQLQPERRSRNEEAMRTPRRTKDAGAPAPPTAVRGRRAHAGPPADEPEEHGRGACPAADGRRTAPPGADGTTASEGSTGPARPATRPGPRPRTVRAKIVSLLMVPVVSLLALWGFATVTTAQDIARLGRLQRLDAEVGEPVSAALTALQAERRAAVRQVAAPGADRAAELEDRMRRTDEAVDRLRLDEAHTVGDTGDLPARSPAG